MKKLLAHISLQWLLGICFLALSLVFPAGAAAQTGDEARPQLTVVAPALNMRSGPGVTYAVVAVLEQGRQVEVIGRDAVSGWWQVQLPDDAVGWVSYGAAYVSVSAATDIAPLAASSTGSAGTIVFQTGVGGSIYAIDADGTNLRYLTTGMDPALSPDGQWVAFTRWEGDRDGIYGNVWLINIDGSDEHVIHEYVLNPRAPSWSGDGSKLVIGMQQGGHPDIYRSCGRRPPRGAYDLELIVDEDGNRKFCYTMPADPHWALRMIDVASGAYEDLPSKLYSFSPAFNPVDSRFVVYDSDDGMKLDEGLAGLNLETGQTWDISHDIHDHSPEFSPDGSKLAISFKQDQHWEVHVMNADGSNRQRLTRTSYTELAEQLLADQEPHSHNNAAPVWSPDGSQIAFLTDRTGQWEIWLMNADGSNQHPLFDSAQQAELGLQYHGVDEQMLSWQ